MKKIRIILLFFILFLVIGFASVNTNLNLLGTVNIALGRDFDVQIVYLNVNLAGPGVNGSISEDGQSIDFLGTYVELSVQNNSTEYDAYIELVCDNDLGVVLTGTFPSQTRRTASFSTHIPRTDVSCHIEVTPISRTEIITDTLMIAEQSTTEYLGKTLDRSLIKTVTFKDTINIPSNAIDSWDVSIAGDGTIMAYTTDAGNGLYNVFICQEGGVKANISSGYLFKGMTNLTSVNGLEYFDTSQVTDMNSIFRDCTSLTTLNLNSLDVRNVTSLFSAFYNCKALVKLGIDQWNTQSLQSLQNTFYNCQHITSLNLSGWDVSKVSNMSSGFSNMFALQTLNVSNWDTGSVTDFSYTFQGDKVLYNIDLSKWNTSSVTTFKSFLYNCYAIRGSLTIMGTSCTTYDQMFNYTAKNASSNFIVNYTSDAQTLATNMVANKTSDAKVALASTSQNQAYLYYFPLIGTVGWQNTSIESITFLTDESIPTGATNITSNVVSYTLDDDEDNLLELYIAKEAGNLIAPPDSTNLFGRFTNLTSIVGAEYLDVSRVTNMTKMFYGLSNLTYLNLDTWDPVNVTNTTGMFYNCRNLSTVINITGSRTDTYTAMFTRAATAANAEIYVNYTQQSLDNVMQMVDAATGHVYLGSEISNQLSLLSLD